MKFNKKRIDGFKNPLWSIVFLNNIGIHILSDKAYTKLLYKLVFKKKLDFKNPQTYNEKLNWLKLYDRKDIYTTLVDKNEVKKYVANIIGDEFIIPTLGVYDKFNDINFDELPNQFVLKCTHDSGGIVICKDKTKFDIKAARKKINKCLKKNYYYVGREWPYKNIKPKIIAEKYMVDESGNELKDYKFFCFNGKAKLLFVALDRPFATKFNFYDLEFNKLPIKQHYPNFDKEIQKPKGFEKMIELAEKLSKDLIHARIDFYDINGQVYFGEITFYHFGGLTEFEPEKYDKILGNMIKLPQINKK